METKFDEYQIVNIEAKTFEQMLTRFEHFTARMEQLYHLHGEKEIGEWQDNQDVCLLLNISPQTLRDNGTLGFTRINHKIYYKPEDVKKIIPIVEDKRKQAKYKGKTI